MRKNILRMGLLSAMLASVLGGQDIAGDWQGTLKSRTQELRIIVKIAKADGGGWNGALFTVDRNQNWGGGTPLDTVTFRGSNLKFTAALLGSSYQGRVAADGSSITGMWTLTQTQALELRRATAQTAWKDPLHTMQFVAVEKGVVLEVLDWGGYGRPLVLLTGLGDTAHVFDRFAPKLTAQYHVYGITRRGFGLSSVPDSGYSADRLGDDVLAVLDSLKLVRPVLAGHSIGGEELSSVGSRHPERVAGLIYLDAGYAYAYYDRLRGNLNIDLAELKRKLAQMQPGKDSLPVIHELLETLLPTFENDLREAQKDLEAAPQALPAAQVVSSTAKAAQAIMASGQRYTNIPVPILAIYAVPRDMGPFMANSLAARAAIEASDEAQVKVFETGVPSARVVRLANANHYVFRSNEADVLREMNAFLGSLP